MLSSRSQGPTKYSKLLSFAVPELKAMPQVWLMSCVLCNAAACRYAEEFVLGEDVPMEMHGQLCHKFCCRLFSLPAFNLLMWHKSGLAHLLQKPHF